MFTPTLYSHMGRFGGADAFLLPKTNKQTNKQCRESQLLTQARRGPRAHTIKKHLLLTSPFRSTQQERSCFDASSSSSSFSQKPAGVRVLLDPQRVHRSTGRLASGWRRKWTPTSLTELNATFRSLSLPRSITKGGAFVCFLFPRVGAHA